VTEMPQFSDCFELCRSCSPREKKKWQACQHDNNLLLIHYLCQILQVLEQGEPRIWEQRGVQCENLWFWCDVQGAHSCWSSWRAGERVSEVRPAGVRRAQSWRHCPVRCADHLHAWPRGSRESLWAAVWFAGSLPPVPEPPLPCHAFLSPKSSLWTGSCDGAVLRIKCTMVLEIYEGFNT